MSYFVGLWVFVVRVVFGLWFWVVELELELEGCLWGFVDGLGLCFLGLVS